MQKMLENKNLQDMEDFQEELFMEELYRTNKGLMNNNHHKTKNSRGVIQVTTHSIKNQGFQNFWMGLF